MIPTYMIAALYRGLAEDPRTNLLDVHIEIVGKDVFLLGVVSSAERAAAAEQVVREILPEALNLMNELRVDEWTELPTTSTIS